ncbi:uncharacterized protein V1510DRAFT_402055 [Dipodascopsis tothii]|uniref:uncharacterized protein n=1 Tax=Dipodascopsis tothii TaxID=44089 RepID=UPI0034CE450E
MIVRGSGLVVLPVRTAGRNVSNTRITAWTAATAGRAAGQVRTMAGGLRPGRMELFVPTGALREGIARSFWQPNGLAGLRRFAAEAAAVEQEAGRPGRPAAAEAAAEAAAPAGAPAPVERRRRPQSLASAYLALAKPQLTALIVLTTMSSYALAPASDAAATGQLPSLLFLTAGTALTSAAANAINMGREPEFDAQMSRTRNRPIVRKTLSSAQAYAFAGVTGTVGAALLYWGVNPTTAGLAVANIALYSGLYTSLKRVSIVNTWVGAIVGAIPPLMGWAAADVAGNGWSVWTAPGAWCLAGLLYAWQFPHFNSLSYTIRNEYRAAGYQMTAWTNPALNARVSLRYSLLVVPLCLGLSYAGVTDWVFAADSTVVNAWLVAGAVAFWRKSDTATARKLFFASIIQLPVVLVLAMVHKKGLWDGVLEMAGLGPAAPAAEPAAPAAPVAQAATP